MCATAVAHAEPPPEAAFIYYGDSEPNGIDRLFLSLAARHGATTLSEAPGRPSQEPLAARLGRAVAAYDALHLADASAELEAIERLAIADGGGGLKEGELVDLYTYRAAARIALGNPSAGWDDLIALATLAPGHPLDPARFPPRILESARRAAQATSATATLTVAVAPADAIVVIDGTVMGQGRIERVRPIGRHFVRGERAGFRSAGRTIDLGPTGASVRLDLVALAPPSPAFLARRGALAGVKRVVGAFVVADGDHARLDLVLVDTATAASIASAHVVVDEHLSVADLETAVATLFPRPVVSVELAQPTPASARPWYRSAVPWVVAAGVIAAVAVGVGLGVGLSRHAQDPGVITRVDLGPAR